MYAEQANIVHTVEERIWYSTVGLHPLLVAFSLYCWLSPYTVGLLPLLVAFSLYCWLSPYTVGLYSILLAFSLYCWPSPYTVGLLPILLAFSLYCWPSPYTAVGLLPYTTSPYTIVSIAVTCTCRLDYL